MEQQPIIFAKDEILPNGGSLVTFCYQNPPEGITPTIKGIELPNGAEIRYIHPLDGSLIETRYYYTPPHARGYAWF